MKKKNLVPLFKPYFRLYTHAYMCFSQFYCVGPTKLTKRGWTWPQHKKTGNLQQIANVHSFILPNWSKFLHWQSLCIRDKLHIYKNAPPYTDSCFGENSSMSITLSASLSPLSPCRPYRLESSCERKISLQMDRQVFWEAIL